MMASTDVSRMALARIAKDPRYRLAPFDSRDSVAFKPTSSLRIPCRSLDEEGNEVEVVTKGRHDPCVGIRATPIVEAMFALVLMDHVLRHRAQLGREAGQ